MVFVVAGDLVYSILDIDLDYFNQLPESGVGLDRLLNWAGRHA